MKLQKKWAMALAGISLLALSCTGINTAEAGNEKYSSKALHKQHIEKGRSIFSTNCQACHQEDAIGKVGLAPSLANQEFLSIASNRFLDATIRHGRSGTSMPPFGAFLKDDDIRAVVSYLRSLAVIPYRGEQVDSEPRAWGDFRLGKNWFDQICSTCHGVNGDGGYGSGGAGTAIGKKGFLDTVSDGFLRETIRSGRSNTRMLGFQGSDGLANLSDKEIDDIITYLRTVPSKDN